MVICISSCSVNSSQVDVDQLLKDEDYLGAYYAYKSMIKDGDNVRGFFGIGGLVDGRKLPQDILNKEKSSLYYFCQGALRGHDISQFIIGLNYSLAKDVPYDINQAILWYKLSANQGLLQSQYRLGYTYLLGMEVEKDLKEALFWFALSEAEDSKISEITSQLNEEEINDVIAKVEVWKPVARVDSIPSNVDLSIRPDLSICKFE